MLFSKQPEFSSMACTVTKNWLALWGGFPDPGLPLMLLGRALITNALLILPNHPEEMKKKGKTGKNFTLKLENKQNRKP